MASTPFRLSHETAVPYGAGLRRLWRLDPRTCYLNHGSFGATPRPVLTAQNRWRARLERQPVRFMTETLPQALRRAAEGLAGFLGASGKDLAFVDNATTGVNTVLNAFPWSPGDELLLSSHAYPAVRNAAVFVAQRFGARVREAAIPFPLSSPQEVVAAYAAAITCRTRLILVEHVTSASALVLPIREIAALARQRGIAVLVDGAHGPGMVPVELAAIGADWYTGNCHKWLFAPKGCAFLWASRPLSVPLHPLVVSNRHGEGFPGEFDWTGTKDPSPWLSVTAALDCYQALGGLQLAERNRALAREGASLLAAAWGVCLPAPSEMTGAMATVPVPGGKAKDEAAAKALSDSLWRCHRIEIPVFPIAGRLYLRVSAQAYNELQDYTRLAEAVLALAGR